jgi:cytochrome c
MNGKLILLALLLLGIGNLAFVPRGEEAPRPLDPWVFRTVLDGKAGSLVAALHKDMWIAYDVEQGTLYRAWRGSVIASGAVFTGTLGGQPKTDGFTFFAGDGEDRQVWTVRRKGGEETPKVRFSGYRVLDNVLTLNYELTLQDGSKIRVEEQPEYRPKKDNTNRAPLERVFRLYDLPDEDTEVVLSLKVSNLLLKGDLKSNSKLKNTDVEKRHFDWGTSFNLESDLLLNTDEPTELTMIFTLDLEAAAKKRN